MILHAMEKIIIHHQDVIHFIDPNLILYCQSDNCYTNVYLAEGEKYLVVMSLSKFAKELGSQFIRVNQSFLINSRYIKKINKKNKTVVLMNRLEVPFTITIKNLMLLIKG